MVIFGTETEVINMCLLVKVIKKRKINIVGE